MEKNRKLFIRSHATLSDLDELKLLISKKENELKKLSKKSSTYASIYSNIYERTTKKERGKQIKKLNRQEYINNYNSETYKKFAFRVKKEEAEKIEEFIKNNTNLSVNAFIKEAVEEKIKNLSKII